MLLAEVSSERSDGLHVHTQNGWYVFGVHRWESDQEAIHGYAINVTKRIFSAWVDSHGEQEFTVPLLQKLLSDINKRSFREALVKDLAITLRDNTFLSTLDNNKSLLGFNNGVTGPYSTSRTGRFEWGVPRIESPSPRGGTSSPSPSIRGRSWGR